MLLLAPFGRSAATSNECINIFIIQIEYTAQSWQNCWQHAKAPQLAWMKNLKFATLPFKTDIPQPVAFSIRESMSASDKSSYFESAEAMV